MTDNKDFDDDHDEFKFDDDDVNDTHDFSDEDDHSVDAAAQSKTKKSSKFAGKLPIDKFSLDAIAAKMPGKLQNKRVLLGVIFVILVILVYVFLGGSPTNEPIAKSANNGSSQAKLGLSAKPASFSNASLTPAAKTKPVNVKAEEAKMNPQPKVKPPVNINKEFSVSQPMVHSSAAVGVSKGQLDSVITDLEKNLQRQNAQQLQMLSSKLESQLSNLQVQNQHLHDSIVGLHKQLGQYKTQLTAANHRLHAVELKVTDIVNGYVGAFSASGASHYHAVPQHATAKSAPQVTTYTVQAVVPGRAWLAGSNGQTLSVNVGQKVSGYGSVMAIDSNAGTVTMSNGMVLKPGA